MSRPLQQIGYKASNYERPNERFSCGRLAEGKPCDFGPSSKGSCGWVCTPRPLEGGGAECGRPASHMCSGGPARAANGKFTCSQVPCQPRPTLRRARGLVCLAAVVVTAGLLALLISHPAARDQLTSPGDLSLHHSALKCADCHATAAEGTTSWTSAALKQEHLSEQIDSQKCSKCHKLASDAWSHAHSLPAGQLEQLQEHARGRWSDGAERPEPGLMLAGARFVARQYGTHDADGFIASHKLECSSCHREHTGRDNTLVAIPEHRCHVCHTVAFESFEDGHPEFNSFGRRELSGNSIFTHWNHYENATYFPKGQKLACTECHDSDDQGRHMVLKPKVFELVCARCHQHRVNLAPLDVIQAPQGPVVTWLDDLTKRPPGVKEVPQIKPTDLMLLLMPDVDHEEAEKAWKYLRSRYRSLMRKGPEDDDGDGKFSEGDGKLKKKDLKRLKSKKVKKYVKIAREYSAKIEQLVAALAKGDVEPIRKALGLGADADLSSLARFLPTKPFQTFKEAWWDPEGSLTSRTLKLDPPPNLRGAWLGAGSWVANDALVGIRYEGYSHIDPFLKAWLDLIPLLKEGAARDKLIALQKERCGKCHFDAQRPAATQVRWEALPPPKTRRRLTHFAHDPHLEVSPDCRGCHSLPKEQPQRAASDFVIAKDWKSLGEVGAAGCLKCHNEAQYGASCQMCHDYHAGASAPGTGTFPLRLMEEPKAKK